MDCPRCGYRILDPNPRFCPSCGFDFSGAGGAARTAGTEVPASADLPSESRPQPATPPDNGERAIKGSYYLLSLLTVVGGILGYRAVRRYNPRVAATIFTISLLLTLVYIGVGYEVYSTTRGPGGTPDMVITGVTYPNSTVLRVTVENQGTIKDGLESVAVNNGTLWLVYGLLSPNSAQASSEIQAGNLSFSLYGYILNNGTDVTLGGQQSATVGTEGFPPGHVVEVFVPFAWTPLSNYTVFISTSSKHPYEVSSVSPILPP